MWLFQFLQMNPHFPKLTHLWRSAMCKQKVKDILIFRTIYFSLKMFENIVTASSGSDMEEAYSARKPPLQVAVQRWSKSDVTRVFQNPTNNRCCLCCWENVRNCSLRGPTSESSWWAHYARARRKPLKFDVITGSALPHPSS